MGTEVYSKRLGLLKEAIPWLTRMSYLGSHANWQSIEGQAVREAGERAGVFLVGSLVDDPMQDLDYRRAFASISHETADPILVGVESSNFWSRRLIIELAGNARLPTMFAW